MSKTQIHKATLNIVLTNGMTLELDVTPAMLELLFKGSGIELVRLDEKKITVKRLDEDSIRKKLNQLSDLTK